MSDVKNIKLFLMDMDGTVYIGDKKIEGAFEALEELKRRGKKVLFLTNNSSKTAVDYVKKLSLMGYPATEKDIFSSGEATIRFLRENRQGKKVLLLANSAVYKQFKEAGINLVKEDADLVLICFDTELDYKKLTAACNCLFEGKEYIVSHPDLVCPANPHSIPDVGSFMALIKAVTGREPDLVIGKPYKTMAEYVAKDFGLRPDEIAMVGDRLYTDIKFATDNGMTSILVLTGETTLPDLEKSDVKPDVVLGTFKDVLKLL